MARSRSTSRGRRHAARSRVTVTALIIGVLALVFAMVAPYAPTTPAVPTVTSVTPPVE